MSPIAIIAILSLVLLPLGGGLIYLVYLALSTPLRHRERARVLLSLVESGLKHGQSAEHTIVGAAESGDRSVGWRFVRLGRLVRQGLTFIQALEAAPGFLSPQLVATLKAGQEIGDLAKVLGACRAQLKDAVTEVWTAQHYLMLLVFVVTPAWVITFGFMAVFVFPRFVQVAQDMEVAMTGLFPFMCRHAGVLVLMQAGLVLIFYGAAFLYIGGPRVSRLLGPLSERVAWWVSWRRKRLQRDFSWLLAILLDAGLPEARAVTLAAAATANRVFMSRAKAVVEDLKQGVALPGAVRLLDDAGEFRWRLSNAARARGGFMAALAGWHEALDAKVFQQEQTAAQLITTSLVLVNGLFVGSLVVAVFQMLISITEVAPLW
jgi:type II secretory pathway component PulF